MDGKEWKKQTKTQNQPNKTPERLRQKKHIFKNYKMENKQNNVNLEKSVDGYKLPHERETMSTLTILLCNLIIPPFIFGESVQESMPMA